MYITRVVVRRSLGDLEVVQCDGGYTVLDGHIGIHPHQQQSGGCLVRLRHRDCHPRLHVPPRIAVHEAGVLAHKLHGGTNPRLLYAVAHALQARVRTIDIDDLHVTFRLVTQPFPVVCHIVVACCKGDVAVGYQEVVRWGVGICLAAVL